MMAFSMHRSSVGSELACHFRRSSALERYCNKNRVSEEKLNVNRVPIIDNSPMIVITIHLVTSQLQCKTFHKTIYQMTPPTKTSSTTHAMPYLTSTLARSFLKAILASDIWLAHVRKRVCLNCWSKYPP